MLNVVILAAGQGTRMKSDLPKVLHPVGAKPMLAHVLDTARQLQPQRLIVIYGHGGRQVIDNIAADDVLWVEQEEQLGTGHAVAQGLDAMSDQGTALILYGDVPLTRSETLQQLTTSLDADSLALLTVTLDDPTGYGRILRDVAGKVVCIREEKDADEDEKQVKEVNTGILAVAANKLHVWLNKLENNNSQGEYYLTDIIAMAVAEGMQIKTAQPQAVEEVLGVNSKTQLAYLERHYQFQQAEKLMNAGVTVIDPARIDVRGSVRAGRDVTVDINVVLEGDIEIGDNVSIGAGCVLRNVTIEDGVQILPMCVIEDARIGSGSQVGPYSRIRPGAILDGDNHIGNFVEIKNSSIGKGSKVNHLTYIGDTDMGSSVNIGAGTITANYDGANKHRTTIKDNASTGSNSVLVAPVNVGEGATLGAGTILRKDAPAEELTLSMSHQKSIKGWKRPKKSD